MILFFATLTLAGQALLVLGILLYIFKNSSKTLKKYSLLVSKNAVPLGLLVAAIATIGSLSFSEILGLTPCKLCWFQRIFMYPQVIILGAAILINDTRVKIYSLILSLIGLATAIYHILVQVFPASLNCTDEIAKCSAVQFAVYGYITIPVMSATAFALIIMLMVFSYLKKK